MKKNFWLDVFMLVSGIICIATGIVMDFHIIPGGRAMKGAWRAAHIYSGYLMYIGLVFHLLWHREWIAGATKKIFRRNGTP